MKYIRTKDGIYETIDYDQLPNNLKKQLDEREHSCMKDYKKMGVFAKMKQGAVIISNIQPILLFAVQNQADTIEELCDRCVVIHKYSERPQDLSFYEAQYFIDVWTRKVKSNDPVVAIYGAVWTDKGLIYVAKMNDKGELELL